MKYLFTYASTLMYDAKVERSKHFIKSFLLETSEKYNIKQHLFKFYKKIEYIQHEFKKSRIAFTMRCATLSELWEREKGHLIKTYIAKRSKKNSALMKKITNIHPETKELVIKAFLLRCKYKY